MCCRSFWKTPRLRLRLDAAASAPPTAWGWLEEDAWPGATACAETLDLPAAGVAGEELWPWPEAPAAAEDLDLAAAGVAGEG